MEKITLILYENYKIHDLTPIAQEQDLKVITGGTT